MCFSITQCIYQDLIQTLLILGLIVPLLILVIWQKEIFKQK